uniref:1(10),5-germacradien-4-ol synthase n=1 Tax=Pinus sylvestris TaxID=3349 RepID=B4XAK5_PINSY|nr:1(10),5-germacradien-4-ol synthase [Pinus sylvestris]
MALVSVTPLISRSGVHRLPISSKNDRSALCQQLSSAGMVMPKKSVTPILSMSTQRRTGNHHSNVWDDDVIHSLSTSYAAPTYRERGETLVEDIKHRLLNDMKDSCSDAADDLIRRLQMVDIIECLGIDRHFQPEIKEAIDYVYRYWNETGIGLGSRNSGIKDLNATALGFRALRMHRYNVSSDVLENFKDESGQFFCSSSTGEEGNADKEVRSMLSLFRASNISFPGEKVMEEAKTFTTQYLTQVLTGHTAADVDQSLQREVKYALEFPWHCSVPRWEARNFIEIYEQNYSWLKSIMNQKILELAKLDFNILQCTHKEEMQLISRWRSESYLPQLDFYRKRHVELYFWAVLGTFEPEFRSSRIAFTKLSTVMTVIDDLYDTHGTLDEIKIFTEGVRRWDTSLISRLPDHIQKIFEFFMKTSNEWTAEVEKKQGRDMAAYIRKNGWERYVESYLQEGEWMAAGYVPSFNEYYKNGLASSGMCVLNLIPLLLMDQILPDDILKQIVYPSKIHELLELTIRVKDDITDFEKEKEHGQVASCSECYMKDNPECTREDALNHMKGILDLSVSQLNWEFLKHDNVPLCYKRFTFNLARGMHFLFKYNDGITLSDNEVKDQIFKVLIQPLQL